MAKKNNDNKRNFLLGFFKQEIDRNEALPMNGFILFKHWDGNSKHWCVDIFTKESYQAMKEQRSLPIQEERLF